MRLLAEILIIAALIYFGWNKPFNEYVAQANTTITTKLHGAREGAAKTPGSLRAPILVRERH